MIRFSFLKVMFVAFFLVMSMVLMRPTTTFSQDALALSTAWAADTENATLNGQDCYVICIDQHFGNDAAFTQCVIDCTFEMGSDFASGAVNQE
ncbi:hypothetical protein MYX76_03890 [Desulfobacterota bacterium AH_259_B03_O07]|nr:hypothetical protein [Desulfobacterota bacterium AH_259_B03_O07]